MYDLLYILKYIEKPLVLQQKEASDVKRIKRTQRKGSGNQW